MISTYASQIPIRNPLRAEIPESNAMEQSIYQLSSKRTNLPLSIRSTYKPNHGFSGHRQIAYHEPGSFMTWPSQRGQYFWLSPISLNMPIFFCLRVLTHAILSAWIALFLVLGLINFFSIFTSLFQLSCPQRGLPATHSSSSPNEIWIMLKTSKMYFKEIHQWSVFLELLNNVR